MLKAIIDAYRKYSMYRSTYNELSNLTERELKDLGLNESMIKIVAREAAYGKEKYKKSNILNDIFNVKTEKDKIEEYLSESENIVDLENRIKDIDRGLAPWQIRARHYAQGWM
jgi:uncharacterized protein YjiS (DUF1127 family)